MAERVQSAENVTNEIRALEAVLSALAPLDSTARKRVLRYAHDRFGSEVADLPDLTAPREEGAGPEIGTTAAPDVRSLKEAKQPSSAVEMAVLAAYYASELAPEGERSTTLGTAELTRYFKQAGYPLPSSPRMTLFQAKNAGYLDSAERGRYRLNPVGHNLIAHGLPRDSGRSGRISQAPRATRSNQGRKGASGAKRRSDSSKRSRARRR